MATNLGIGDLPSRIHLQAMERFILLPEMTFPLVLTDPDYVEFVEELAAAKGFLGFVQSREPAAGGGRRYQEVGCLGRVQTLERRAERLFVSFQGVIRFRIRQELPEAGGGDLPSAEVDYREFAHDLEADEGVVPGWDLERIRTTLLDVGRRQGAGDPGEMATQPPKYVIKRMAQVMPFSAAEKQALLEALTFRDLLELLFRLLAVNFLTTTPDAGGTQVH